MKFPYRERFIVTTGVIGMVVILILAILVAVIVTNEQVIQVYNRYQMWRSPSTYSACRRCGNVYPHKEMTGKGKDAKGEIQICDPERKPDCMEEQERNYG